MIIINYPMGLGNQLNLYALYIKLKEMGKCVKFENPYNTEKSYYLNPQNVKQLDLRQLDVYIPFATDRERNQYTDDSLAFTERVRRVIRGTHRSILREEDITELNTIDNVYLQGVFDPRYTWDILDKMRETIRWKPSTNPLNVQLLTKLEKNNHACFIHIRRTDYLQERNSFLNITTEKYYDIAISYIEEHDPEVEFFVFSDDKEYIEKKYTSKKFNVVNWNSDEEGIYDLQIMTKCRYGICANSSFSTWGGLLGKNTEIIIKPMRMKNVVPEYYSHCNIVPIIAKTGEIVS